MVHRLGFSLPRFWCLGTCRLGRGTEMHRPEVPRGTWSSFVASSDGWREDGIGRGA